MADIQSHDPLGKSAGQPGSTKPQASSGGSAIADQARETLRTATDRASETWDDVSKRGTDWSCPSMRWKFGVELERPSVRRPEVELL